MKVALWSVLFLGVAIGFSAAAQETEVGPTQTYLAYHEALWKLDRQALQKLWLPGEMTKGSEEAVTQAILSARQMSPTYIDVTGEKIVGNESFLTVIGTYPNGGKSEGKIYLVKTVDRWKVRGESWGFIEVPPPPAVSAEGVIAGAITLPEGDAKGSLYVFAVPKNQDQSAGYTVIQKEQIVWKIVPYQIDHLPAGSYWVYAAWDTAAPFFGEDIGLFSASTGDYVGEFLGTVTLDEKERRDRVDFICDRTMKSLPSENYGRNYSLTDLVVKTAEGKPKFFLSVQNESGKPIQAISLQCFINGKELAFASSAPGTLIPPHHEREFDITTCYDSYLFFLEKVWQDENLSKTGLLFEIVSRENKSTLKKEVALP